MPMVNGKSVPSAKAKAAAKARLKLLDKKATQIKKNKLRAEATMGSRKARKKASTKLSGMKRK
jgi:hypothetical protein